MSVLGHGRDISLVAFPLGRWRVSGVLDTHRHLFPFYFKTSIVTVLYFFAADYLIFHFPLQIFEHCVPIFCLMMQDIFVVLELSTQVLIH